MSGPWASHEWVVGGPWVGHGWALGGPSNPDFRSRVLSKSKLCPLSEWVLGEPRAGDGRAVKSRVCPETVHVQCLSTVCPYPMVVQIMCKVRNCTFRGYSIGQILAKYWISMSNLCPRASELDRHSTGFGQTLYLIGQTLYFS